MQESARLRKDIAFLNTNALRIGWVSNPLRSAQNRRTQNAKMRNEKGLRTPKTVGEVARAHELGLGSVPKRSMLKATMKRRRPQIRKLQRQVVSAVVAGNVTSLQGLSLLGEGVLSEIKDRMVKGISPPLARSTRWLRAAPRPWLWVR